MNLKQPTIRAGDLSQAIGDKNKAFIFHIVPGQELQTHLGILRHDQLIGLPWGSTVHTHLGKPLLILQPALDDVLRTLKRNTQIIYPKDLGYILISLNIGPTTKVIEAGTGSGALTAALAHYVWPQGHVYTYDHSEVHQKVARANLYKLGLSEYVTFHCRDLSLGFLERGVDALFLDLQNPDDFVQHASQALKPGGFFGALLPTVNQVSALITALKKHGFSFLEVSEILHRYYKPTATRLRPVDRMIAHTGFLIFARLAHETVVDASIRESTTPH